MLRTQVLKILRARCKNNFTFFMKLSIVINVYKERGFVRQLLLGIQKLNLPFEYEVMVIDSGSRDGTGDMVRYEFPLVKIFESCENIGHQKGHNIGFKNTSGEYILSMNADIVFLKDSISPLIQFMDAHPEAGIVSPKLLNPDGTEQNICLRYSSFFTPFYRRTFLGNTKRGKQYLQKILMSDEIECGARDVERVQGSFMLIRRKALEKIGYFDEQFFLYYGDEDLCRRMHEKKYSVYYLPDIDVIHYYHRQSQISVFFALFHAVSRWHILDWLKYLWKYRTI